MAEYWLVRIDDGDNETEILGLYENEALAIAGYEAYVTQRAKEEHNEAGIDIEQAAYDIKNWEDVEFFVMQVVQS
jgi:hypothetical protein